MADDSEDTAPRIVLDFQRSGRTGLDDAILAEGKSVHQLETIIGKAQEQGARLLFTRLSNAQFAALSEACRGRLDYDAVSDTAILGEVGKAQTASSVCIVSAGASDARVSGEAARTLHYYGEASRRFSDVGVAGLWRLTERIEDIARFPVVIVIAGMEASMATVLGGLVRSVIIVVPTSAGYGVADGGRTALNAVLMSCSPGLTVVNIDNGYGGACAAIRVLNAMHGSARNPDK